MANPIRNGYEALDSLIMKGVNTGVRAYNWTTGGTKAGLANNLLTAASIIDSSAAMISPFPMILAPLIIPVSFCASHIFQNINKKIEERELKAQESGALDLYAETLKRNQKANGYTYGMFGTLMLIPSNYLFAYGLSAGFGARAFSSFVMNADNLPPRKNCVARGLDKLSDIVQSYQPKPAPSPVPA